MYIMSFVMLTLVNILVLESLKIQGAISVSSDEIVA